jgi:excisionase family DNA binding protein
MGGIELEGASQTVAVTDRPTHRIRSEGSVTEVRRRQRLLPIGAAAEYLGVSRATIERLVYRGELPIVKVAGSTRYDVEDLDFYVTINRYRIRKRTA